jgi:hypothetical protein
MIDARQGKRNILECMISCTNRELAIRRIIVENQSGPDGNAYRRRKATREIKEYEALIEELKRDLQNV